MTASTCFSADGKSKTRWPTPQAAEFVARQAARKAGTPHYSYHCDGCGGWHVTKRRPRGRLTDAAAGTQSP